MQTTGQHASPTTMPRTNTTTLNSAPLNIYNPVDYVDLTGTGIRESIWSSHAEDGTPVQFSYYPEIDRFGPLRVVNLEGPTEDDDELMRPVPLDFDTDVADVLFEDDDCTTTEEYVDVYVYDNAAPWYDGDAEGDDCDMCDV